MTFLVTATVRGRVRILSKPLTKSQAVRFASDLKRQMKSSIPKFRFATNIKVRKRGK